LIALIINAHPKIDERDAESFSQNQCLPLGLRPLSSHSSKRSSSAVAHQKTNTDVKTRFSSRLTQQRGG